MPTRFAVALFFALPVTSAVAVAATSTFASAHSPTFAHAAIAVGQPAGARAPSFRLGVQGSLGHTTTAGAAQPFVPLHVPRRSVEPTPAATPEWNPLKRRRMAMPNGTLPGGDPDFDL